MARTTKTITLSLPPEMVDKIEELMKEEGRTRSELLREALRRYAEEQEMEKDLPLWRDERQGKRESPKIK